VTTVVELAVADEPAAWRDAGFTVADGAAGIGGVRVRCVGPAGHRGIVAWTLGGVRLGPDTCVDGLATAVDERAGVDEPEPAAHANGTVAIDHVVIATPHWPRTIAAFEAIGCELRRERAAGTDDAPMRQGFFRAGDVILEIVGPREPVADGGPARFFGLALTVADLDATKRFYGDALSDPKPAVQRDRRIATLRHREVGISTAIAFMSA
jgi:hypothetical protein